MQPVNNKNLSNEKAKDLVKMLMKNINESKNLRDLENIPENLGCEVEIKRNMPGSMYPKLDLKMTQAEIEQLKKSGCINDENQIATSVATGQLPNKESLTALEKLLFSMIWKNGDLGKEKNLINGIMDVKHTGATGAVFYEFGRYISGLNPFILNQHTLRCFGVYCEEGETSLTLARKLRSVNSQNVDHQKWIFEYKHLYTELLQDKNRDSDFLYQVDRLLFGVGKLIKIA